MRQKSFAGDKHTKVPSLSLYHADIVVFSHASILAL